MCRRLDDHFGHFLRQLHERWRYGARLCVCAADSAQQSDSAGALDLRQPVQASFSVASEKRVLNDRCCSGTSQGWSFQPVAAIGQCAKQGSQFTRTLQCGSGSGVFATCTDSSCNSCTTVTMNTEGVFARLLSSLDSNSCRALRSLPSEPRHCGRWHGLWPYCQHGVRAIWSVGTLFATCRSNAMFGFWQRAPKDAPEHALTAFALPARRALSLSKETAFNVSLHATPWPFRWIC